MILSILTLPFRFAAFVCWFAAQLTLTSVRVLGDILSPGLAATPRVVRLPLGSAGDLHVTAISVLITLTPGTLALGAARDDAGARFVIVHSLYHRDTDSALADYADMDRRMTRAVALGGSR